MTTSTITAWTNSRDEIITQALEIVGGVGEGQTANADQLTRAIPALNNIVKLFAADGMPLWKKFVQSYVFTENLTVYSITAGWKPLQVLLVDVNGGTQYELIERSVQEFNLLSNTTAGMPNSWVALPTLTSTDIAVWPKPDSGAVSNKIMSVVYQGEYNIFTTGTDTPDFPDYYNDAIIYTLAVRLAPRYGLPIRDRQLLIQEATAYKTTADGFNQETASLLIQPDRTRYWRGDY